MVQPNIIIQGFFPGGQPRFPVSQPSSVSQTEPISQNPSFSSLQLKPGTATRDFLAHEGRALKKEPCFPRKQNDPVGNTNMQVMSQPIQKKGVPFQIIPEIYPGKKTAPADPGTKTAGTSSSRRYRNPVLQTKQLRQNDGMLNNGSAYLMQKPPPRMSGQALPPLVQAKMEALFGTDFSDVRVHVGLHVSSIGALAYTHGTNIHFAPGQYNPMSIQGQRLLGHELAHVIQQRNGKVVNPFGGGTAVVIDHGLESEADRMGLKAAAGPPVLAPYPRNRNNAG